jgi:hypothetical protein
MGNTRFHPAFPVHSLTAARKFYVEGLLKRARRKKLKFYAEPKIRFPDTPIEHRSFFLQDHSGNLLEFKFYKFSSAVFGKSKIKKVGDRN